jgi:hypothetical protein
VSFVAALKIILQSLPALMRLVSELAAWLKANFGDNPAKAIEEHAEAIKQIKEAKTHDEKAAAASRLSSLIRKL